MECAVGGDRTAAAASNLPSDGRTQVVTQHRFREEVGGGVVSMEDRLFAGEGEGCEVISGQLGVQVRVKGDGFQAAALAAAWSGVPARVLL